MDIDALDAVIQPLISAICPKYIEEPKEKLSILIRKLLTEELGDVTYAKIVDRFLLDGSEKDPVGSLEKLKALHERIGEILSEME